MAMSRFDVTEILVLTITGEAPIQMDIEGAANLAFDHFSPPYTSLVVLRGSVLNRGRPPAPGFTIIGTVPMADESESTTLSVAKEAQRLATLLLARGAHGMKITIAKEYGFEAK